MEFLTGDDLGRLLEFAEKLPTMAKQDASWYSAVKINLQSRYFPNTKFRISEDLINLAKDYLLKINWKQDWVNDYFDGSTEALYNQLIFSGKEKGYSNYAQMYTALTLLNELVAIYRDDDYPEQIFSRINDAINKNENIIDVFERCYEYV